MSNNKNFYREKTLQIMEIIDEISKRIEKVDKRVNGVTAAIKTTNNAISGVRYILIRSCLRKIKSLIKAFSWYNNLRINYYFQFQLQLDRTAEKCKPVEETDEYSTIFEDSIISSDVESGIDV
jgi:hypothetical protein